MDDDGDRSVDEELGLVPIEDSGFALAVSHLNIRSLYPKRDELRGPAGDE